MNNTWNTAQVVVPIYLTDTRNIFDFLNSGSGTADYIAKMWYLRIHFIHFPLQMWFSCDSDMYCMCVICDTRYAIMLYAVYFKVILPCIQRTRRKLPPGRKLPPLIILYEDRNRIAYWVTKLATENLYYSTTKNKTKIFRKNKKNTGSQLISSLYSIIKLHSSVKQVSYRLSFQLLCIFSSSSNINAVAYIYGWEGGLSNGITKKCESEGIDKGKGKRTWVYI